MALHDMETSAWREFGGNQAREGMGGLPRGPPRGPPGRIWQRGGGPRGPASPRAGGLNCS